MASNLSGQQILNTKLKACDADKDGVTTVGEIGSCNVNTLSNSMETLSSSERKTLRSFLVTAQKMGAAEAQSNEALIAKAHEKLVNSRDKQIGANNAFENMSKADADFRNQEHNETFRNNNKVIIVGLEKAVESFGKFDPNAPFSQLKPEQVKQLGMLIDPKANWADASVIRSESDNQTWITLRKSGELPSVHLRFVEGKLDTNPYANGKMQFQVEKKDGLQHFVTNQVAKYFREHSDILIDQKVRFEQSSTSTPSWFQRNVYDNSGPNYAAQISQDIKKTTGFDVELTLKSFSSGAMYVSYQYGGISGQIQRPVRFDSKSKQLVFASYPVDFDIN